MTYMLTQATIAMLALREGVHLARYDEPHLAEYLSTPTLLVQGSADSIVPPAVAGDLARARPDLVTYLSVPGAEHVSEVDTDPARYTMALRQFLQPFP